MKTKIMVTIICLLFFSSFTSAQWNKVDGITMPYIYSALFSGDNIFVGGDSLFISSDRGVTWEAKTITDQPTTMDCIFRIEDKIFAGTSGRGVYQSLDEGDTWDSFNLGLSGLSLYSRTFALSGDTVFYGTDGSGIYFLKLNSTTWQPYNQNLPSNIAWTINDITVTNTNIIASAGASGFYYLRPKGSAEWIERRIETPRGTFTTPNVFLVMGDTIFSGSRAGIYRSIDNGYNWDSVGISALPLEVVSFAKDNNRIYAGFTRNTDYFIWYSDDFGNTWNSYDHQFHYLFHIYIYDDKIWAATDAGLWYHKLTPTVVEPINQPVTFNLGQNYPNPFNPNTRISFIIGQSTNSFEKDVFVSLKIYDILGNEIATLVSENKSAGEYEIEFDAGKYNLSSGVYIYRLSANGFVSARKMIFLE